MGTKKYEVPGVYFEKTTTEVVPSPETAKANAGFLGNAERGKIGQVTFLKSWTEYLSVFANGLASPFRQDYDLAYAVFGFFQNGGSKCWVGRLAKTTGTGAAKKATVTLTAPTTGKLYAKDEGEWANKRMSIVCTENSMVAGTFDLSIWLDGEEDGTLAERFSGVRNKLPETLSGTEEEEYLEAIPWFEAITKSKFIGNDDELETDLEVFAEVFFDGGKEGVFDGETSLLDDEDYLKALKLFDPIKTVNQIAIPGQTSSTVLNGILAYCKSRDDIYPVLDAPLNSYGETDIVNGTNAADEILEFRKELLKTDEGGLLWNWLQIKDPASPNGTLRETPPSGHFMGVNARMIETQGFQNAPAGVDAVIIGAVGTTFEIKDEDIALVNPRGIIPLVTKPGIGVIPWGVRSLSTTKDFKYFNNVTLHKYIRKVLYDRTLPYVFKPNAPELWASVTRIANGVFRGLWDNGKGALKGATEKEAWYVKCDAEVNTEESIEEGILRCLIGYADKKPSEFIVFEFVRPMQS